MSSLDSRIHTPLPSVQVSQHINASNVILRMKKSRAIDHSQGSAVLTKAAPPVQVPAHPCLVLQIADCSNFGGPLSRTHLRARLLSSWPGLPGLACDPSALALSSRRVQRPDFSHFISFLNKFPTHPDPPTGLVLVSFSCVVLFCFRPSFNWSFWLCSWLRHLGRKGHQGGLWTEVSLGKPTCKLGKLWKALPARPARASAFTC